MSEIVAYGRSDVGRRRSNNEDSFVLGADKGFVAVADGMGGLDFGEVASRIFSETAEEVFSTNSPSTEEELVTHTKNIFRIANEKIYRIVEEHEDNRGMGCTAEIVSFCNNRCIVGHVGDSRTYLFRKEELRQITRDHSVVQEQLDQGLITPEQAQNHSLRHVILRAVGIEKTINVDVFKGKTVAGDVFLLCSDGLTDMVDDASVQEVLSQQYDLNKKVDLLIEQANAAGGKDNITVVLCEVA